MRNKYGLIILILVILLLLSGAVLFFAKDNVASFFDNNEDLAALSAPIKISSSINSIDDSVIQSDKFKSLKNNVNNFDFINICKRKTDTSVIVTSIATSSATSTPPEDISCHQGNNNPFIIKKK